METLKLFVTVSNTSSCLKNALCKYHSCYTFPETEKLIRLVDFFAVSMSNAASIPNLKMFIYNSQFRTAPLFYKQLTTA